MRTIKAVMSYDGTAYHGFQRQENAISVQEVVEKAIGKLLKCAPPVIYGCSRTDAGVHAKYYVCSVDHVSSIPPERLPLALNARLPDAVVVRKAVLMPDDFDARFSCVSKEYTYLIHNSRVRDPFSVRRAWVYPQPLNV